MDDQLLKVEVVTPVFLTAARVFDGLTGRHVNRPRQGPYIVERVYKDGGHWRLKAVKEGSRASVDAALFQFEGA